MDLPKDKRSTFSAKEPSLGYLYQVRYGLYLLLTSRSETNTQLLIESLDDIEMINNESVSLYQTKFHLKTKVNLTDRSSDFWKTIRVWSEQIIDKSVDLEKTIFTLITTQAISSSSILLKIQDNTEHQNTKIILDEMEIISSEATNKTNKKAYAAFKGLSKKQKKELINRIIIIDSSLDFSDLDNKIKLELQLSALPKNIDRLYEGIEGWFLQQTIKHLSGKKSNITFEKLTKKLIYLTDQFKPDDLPNDFPDKIIEEDVLNSEENISMIFVKQLQLIGSSNRMKQNAISDYYRAFYQRSKWINDDLLDPQEEIDYEKKLIDDWGRKFDLLLDEVEGKGESKVQVKALKFYKTYYIKHVPQIFIRERFREAYLALGSSHMLSQDMKIGWHPEFEKLKPKGK